MDISHHHKLCLVTGASEGIGFAIAKNLLDSGANVIINGRSQEKLENAKARIGENKARLHLVSGDVATEEGVSKVLEQVKKIGEVDILVNNAGAFEPKPFGKITDEDWNHTFQLNVMSGIRFSRALMEKMREKKWGRIIFISSESGVNIPVEMVHYGVSKGAQISVARGLAKELSGTGVTVNSVLPGPTWTEGVSEFVNKIAEEKNISVEEVKKDFFKEARPNSIIQRFASPEEVANMVSYIASDQASATTGATCRVEGGILE